MKSSNGIMKATGVVHIVHGIIMGLLALLILAVLLPRAGFIGGLFILALCIGFPFLYIYIGYELYALRKYSKMRNLLIVSLCLAGIETLYSAAIGQMAGIIFIAELILSIVALCNLDSYKHSAR